MLYSELLKFEIVDCNKFMSIFKNILELPLDPIYEGFVDSCYSALLDIEETAERAEYLLGKSVYADKNVE
mgnify:FL=1|jgi:hypothetical protein